MSHDDTKFTPEQVEQQIDRLAQFPTTLPASSSDGRLISELYQVYTEDDMIAEDAWQRLVEHVGNTSQRLIAGDVPSQSRSRMDRQFERKEVSHLMHIEATKMRSTNAFLRLLGLCAALLVVAALVAGTALVINSAHQKQASRTTNTVSNTSGLYVRTIDGVAREDLASGKILWHYALSQKPLESEITVYVVDSVAIFEVNPAGSLVGSLVGLDASTGKQLWTQENIHGALSIAGEDVAIVFSYTRNSSSNQAIGIATITAYQATTGRKLWSYQPVLPYNAEPPNTPSYNYALIHGVFYMVYGSQRFALNASTGNLIWKKSLPAGFWRFGTSAPIMSGNMLYFIDSKTGENGNSQTWLFAINSANGNESWHQIFDFVPRIFAPTVVDGTLYVAGRGIEDGGVPHIYAYDAGNGTRLQTYTLGPNDEFYFPLLHVQNLLLYSRSNSRYDSDLVAFSLTTKTPAWLVDVGEPQQVNYPQIANDVIYMPSGNHLLAYTASGKLVHTYDVPTPPATPGAPGLNIYWDFVIVA